MSEQDILVKLEDLVKQATQERSHFYVRSVAVESADEITRLRAALAEEKEWAAKLQAGSDGHFNQAMKNGAEASAVKAQLTKAKEALNRIKRETP